MKSVLLSFFGVVSFFAIGLPSVQAASLYIDPPRFELNRGDAVRLDVRLDVDEAAGECVNAIDAVISYSSNIEPVDVAIGDSIFSVWVEQPTINKENRTITFAGGMPNGYCGRVAGDPRLTNRVVSLIFRAPGFTIGGNEETDDPLATVSFTDQTTAYLNDGFGTAVVPDLYDAELTVNKTAGAQGIVDEWRDAVTADTTPPEEFSIFLEKGNLEFAGEYYITFNTTDKQTGIDVYQVMEQPLEQWGSFAWGRADAPWITARSPYVLEDQSLNSVIRVRAVDKAGNEYVATLLPDESLRGYTASSVVAFIVYGVIALIVLGCVIVIVMYVRQRKHQRRSNVDTEATDDTQGSLDEEDYQATDEYER